MKSERYRKNLPAHGERMGFNATWSMAVGGMVGGGIFSVLGVVIGIAGAHAWLSFLLAGLVALASACSYALLVRHYEKSGGSFTFLREAGMPRFAATLAWLLLGGYILTISVYAFTFGHYLADAFGLSAWLARLAAFAIIAVLTVVNLRGVGDSSLVEIVTVWGKLFVLLALAAFGLYHWAPGKMAYDGGHSDIFSAITGAAAIFMAYEGFQLLAYDYLEIRDARRTLPLATISAVLTVIAVYILVTLGAAMLVGANAIVENKEVALNVAGRAAFGEIGLLGVTLGAVFSTGSAINATLFATSRLMRDVAEQGELPAVFRHVTQRGIPDRAVLLIAGAAAMLAIVGALHDLVEAASLTFLFTFGTVNVLAFRRIRQWRWVTGGGVLLAAAAFALLAWRLLQNSPWLLAGLAGLAVAAVALRPLLRRHLVSEDFFVVETESMTAGRSLPSAQQGLPPPASMTTRKSPATTSVRSSLRGRPTSACHAHRVR